MRLLKNKKGLSVVVTTLIILVVSVLLATVVTFYAINVTTTRVQEESLHLTKQHIWYNTTEGWAEAALVILNTGGRDVVLDKISVRGQECPWSNVYYWRCARGWSIVIYIMNHDSIALNDVGLPVGITVFTSNAQYYVETNIAAAQ